VAAALPSRFPVICGPTASGKSTLAVELAIHLREHHQLAAEIVTADAFQVYRGMDMGTAKPSVAERRGIPHHLIDIAEPSERFTVDQWLERAETTIRELRARQTIPIVVGGTHLYVKALMEGLFEGPGADPAIRSQLEAMDPQERRAQLEAVDPAAATRIHFNDVRRTIRALEVHRLTGRPISDHQQQWDRATQRRDAFLITLNWPTEQLNRRINARVKAMMEAGLLEETRGLCAAGRLGPQACEALGYKQLLEHIEQGAPLEECVERIKIETRRFAKNQRTWLKRLGAMPGTLAFDASQTPMESMVGDIGAAILKER
jgi:tRNA dimethylallyltransferase